MQYRLEIHRPGNYANEGSIKVFTSTSPFLPLRAGDLLNTKTWHEDPEGKLLRVLSVEHLISETSLGIDPSGRAIHQITVYTESVPDTAETRADTGG